MKIGKKNSCATGFVALCLFLFVAEIGHSIQNLFVPCTESAALSIPAHDHQIEFKMTSNRSDSAACIQCILCRGRRKRFVASPLVPVPAIVSTSDFIYRSTSKTFAVREIFAIAPKTSPPV